jgi:beta-galactosidase
MSRAIPAFNLAVRPCSDQQLAAARRQSELAAGTLIFLRTDHIVQGLGCAAVGPGVLLEHRLEVRPADFALTLAPLSV